MKKKRLTLDFESRAKSPLKKEGAFKYSLDALTQPTCLAWKLSGVTRIHQLRFDQINQSWNGRPSGFRADWRALIEDGYEFSAHNAFFERCIYDNILVKRYGWPAIPARQWRCTAAKAAACALPRNLEGAGAAMNLAIQKDKRGYAAMMATCKPTKQWNAWKKKFDRIRATNPFAAIEQFVPIGHAFGDPEPAMFLEPEAAPEVWETLYQYNRIDVLAEENLDDAVPDLSPEEQEIWFLNQALNWRGLRIDIPTVRKIVDMMAEESKKKLKELDALTMGLVTKPGARQSILDFLALEGVVLPNLQSKTVDDKLRGFDLSADMHRLLEIRKALSLTSTKKYHAFLARAGSDDRVRDILMYHGASTGRDTGVGIQPHNFPRGVIYVDKNRPYATVENVATLDPDMLRILYGESLPLVFSSIIRNMIVPTEGYELFVADFSKIEVAVLWWLAGNEPGLKILRAGMDPYKYQAAANTGRDYPDITDEDPARQLGKAQVLGCGFGMGWEKFKATAANPPYRLQLTDQQAQDAVQAYRRTHPAVPALWKKYEFAAVLAVESKGSVSAGKCRFHFSRGFLWVTLPSGRKLAYRDPQIAWRETKYGPRKTLEFFAVNSKTKKWSLERTWGGTITENCVQATARDLMMPAMLRLEKAGYRALLMVHDEGICERETGKGNLDEFVRILCEVPPWGAGLPIEAKGWKGPRYRK